MQKKRVSWVTSDSFLDTDLPIIESISSTNIFQIEWYIIYSKRTFEAYSPEAISKNLKGTGTNVSIVNLNKRHRSIDTFVELLKLFYKIRKDKTDVVYVNSVKEPYQNPICRLLIPSNKIIVTMHDVILHVGVGNVFRKFLELKVRMFNVFHLYSKTQGKIFKEKYGKNKGIYVIPQSLKDFGSGHEKASNSVIQFLFFGTIRNNKGLEFLIKAGNLLYQKYKHKFSIRIAGRCDNWEEYDKLIEHQSVFNVSIGSVANEDIPNLFCSSHYLVLPYKDVTQSGPLLIAYNYNVPAIASNLDGFKEYINNSENGYLFSSESAQALTIVMESAILQHESNYNNIKRNLKKIVEGSASIDTLTSQYVEMFNDIISVNK